MHINYRTYNHVLLQKELRLPLVYLKKNDCPQVKRPCTVKSIKLL